LSPADLKNPFLPHPNIKNAPTSDAVLTLDYTNKNKNWPDIAAASEVNSFCICNAKMWRKEFTKALGKFRGKAKIQKTIQGIKPKYKS
jgi:hypothetical protein